MARPRLLLFDVFGTVVDWRRSLVRQLPAHFAAHGLEVDVAAFADAWRARYQPSMEVVRRGERPWVSLDALHRESLDAVLETFGCADLPISARPSLNEVWHRLDGWPDAAAGLSELRAVGYCCALSNGNVRLMADVARHAGLAWDQILGAEWSRAYKPQPQVYLDPLRLFDVPAAEALIVAAHNADLEAAAALGLATAFVRRPTEYGPDQTTDLAPTGAWSFVAEDFLDLAAQLARA
jgi:2-haloacid dehalogenase